VSTRGYKRRKGAPEQDRPAWPSLCLCATNPDRGGADRGSLALGRLEPGGKLQRGSPKQAGVLEAKLDPVGDSGTRGTATFRERGGLVYLALEASGLPRDGVVYFGVIRKGACDGGQRGRNVGPEYARSGRRASVVVRLDLLSAESAEYAHGGAHANADVLLTSVDGAGRVEVGLKRYDTTEQLLSGGPKSLELHAPSSGDPTIACGGIE
jgi:hypothetical protein